jgi:hypothetical protein
MTALGLSALGLAACDDVTWIIDQAKKGGGASATGGAAPATPGTGGASGQPACTSGVLGGEAVCLDVGSLKANAYLACEKSGMLLNDYVPSGSCGSTTDSQSYRYVKYGCCPKAEPPPPPPPPPTTCTSEVQGGPTSCKDVVTWKRYASDACAAKGATLTDYAAYEDCGNGNTRYVKYVCCGASLPPTPPPATCTGKSQGSPTSCKSAQIWKQYATEDCAATGASLLDASPYDDCGDGGYRYVKYGCCGPASPPPPPPPSTCVTKSHGGSASCLPDATWKQYASDDCAATGASLTGYSPYHDCADGTSRNVQYTCCDPKSPPPVSLTAK